MAPLSWDGKSELLVCPYCGTKFRIKPPSRIRDDGEVLYDGIGRGTVAAVPNIMGDANGVPFLKVYVPEGWMARTGGSGPNYGDPDRDGVHISTTMGHPQECAFIIIRSRQTVRHTEPSLMNPRGERRMNLAGVMMSPLGGGGGLEGSTRTAAEYEDEMVLTVLQNARLTLLKEEDADQKELQDQAQILAAYTAQGVSASADWKRRYYAVTLQDGKRVNAVAETRILSYEIPTLTGQMASGIEEKFGQAFSGLFGGRRTAGQGSTANPRGSADNAYTRTNGSGQSGVGNERSASGAGTGRAGDVFKTRTSGAGGMLGGLLDGSMRRMQNTFHQRFWEVQYELLMIANEDFANEAMQEFMKVRATLQYLPAFEQFRQQSIRTVMQARQQMAADRMASNQRKADIMMDTQRHIHNTMDSMTAANAASHDRAAAGWSDMIRGSGPGYAGNACGGGNVSAQDRIRNGWSEMIKETNTYYGNDGNVYEASTAYDHVYQGNQDQDSFIGTSGTAWEPGVDFDELNRTNGNY